MPEDAIRVLLVGAGNRGRVWAQVCADTPGVELVAIVDDDLRRAAGVRDELPGATPVVGRDLATVFREVASNAVIVATPPESHHAIVSASLLEGKHVLCEKPLSEDIGEVVDLIQKAEETDRKLLVGMNFRYLSTSQRIREYVQEERLGALSYAQFSYVRHRDGNRTELNDYPLTMAHPMLFEQSIHHFDLMRYCYGAEVESLVADSWRPSWSTYEGDCSVSVLLRLDNGAHVNYLGTWTASWNKMSFAWRSEFDSGVLLQRSQFDDLVRVDFKPELALSGANFKTVEDAEPPRIEELPPCTPFVDDSRALLNELRGEPVTTARDHLRSLSVVLASVESIETGRWVTLRELYERFEIPTG